MVGRGDQDKGREDWIEDWVPIESRT